MIPEINIQLCHQNKQWISHDFAEKIQSAYHQLTTMTGKGNEFLGWLKLTETMLKEDQFWSSVESVKNDWVKLQINTVVVIGIGGSYLGTKAVCEALRSPFPDHTTTEVVFAGHHMSAFYLDSLINYLNTRNYGVIVVSKSGTTLEPALAFRILKTHLEQAYGQDEVQKRIITITDRSKGALRNMTDKSGWTSFVIDDSVGGRYSVFSPVSIVPLSLAGYDTKSMLGAADKMKQICLSKSTADNNPSLLYAAMRISLFRQHKTIEVLSSFQPELQYLAEWWKQLFGESDGKDRSGIFPASCIFSTDLHSMGQYIQEGMRSLFETFIIIKKKPGTMQFPASAGNEDGLEYLKGRDVTEINTIAEQATMIAHHEGDVPVIGITINELNIENLGSLMYFFEFACAAGGYLMDINPFDQPGVEAYKRNMFALLGKPGMEKETASLLKKIKSLSSHQ